MKRYSVTVNGKTYAVEVEDLGEVSAPLASSAIESPTIEPDNTPVPAASVPVSDNSDAAVKSPMPGNIIGVKVQAGDPVKYGQVLVILEAMKMENEIVAPKDGTVTAIHVKKGDSVDTNSPLVSLS